MAKRKKQHENIEEFIRKNYRKHSLTAMADLSGIAPGTLYYWVKKMGLKDKLIKQYIRRQNTKKTARIFNVNERQNWLI